MDLAYDRIAEESLPKDRASGSSNEQNSNTSTGAGASSGDATNPGTQPEKQPSLNEDIQDAYRAFSASPWGSWLGGQVSSVVKQGQSVYQEAQQEFTSLGADANRGFANLRARALSLTTAPPEEANAGGASTSDDQEKSRDSETTPTATKPSDLPFYFDKLKIQAAKRLKDIQRAEDAADAALVDFGGKAYDFLRTAIAVTPADGTDSASNNRFETKDESGKRVFHTSRLDAQLHVIHTSENSFTEDPASKEFDAWTKQFDAEKKTDDISTDLAKYPELRANMEKLVPDTVPYAEFWKRYYFLRHSIETAETRRRELLKAASAEEEIGWGEESDDESTPAAATTTTATKSTTEKPARPGSTESSTTIHPPPSTTAAATSRLKAAEPRKSNDEKSQADSDTSYDVVGAQSGNPSQAPSQAHSSPKDSKKADDSSDDEEDSEEDEDSSDDEDWE